MEHKLIFTNRLAWYEACRYFTEKGYGFTAYNDTFTIILTGAY